MSSTPEDTKPKRKRRELPIHIEPIAVSHEIAAAMLAQIGERTLDQLVAEGKLQARQITPGRVGYRYSDLKRYVDEAPIITPGVGVRAAPGDPKAA